MLRLALPIALRYLSLRRREGFISVIAGFSCLGICLGVATLIIVMSVMNGFRQELSGKILEFNSHITLRSPWNEMTNYKDIVGSINRLKNVKMSLPIVEGQAMLTAGNQSIGVMVKGVSASDMKHHPALHDKVMGGSFDILNQDPANMIMGSRLLQSLNLNPGDKVQLIIPDGNITPFGKMPRIKTFVIKAIFETGMYEFDKNFVFIPFETSQKFFNALNRATSVEIFLKDPYYTGKTLNELHQAISTPLSYVTWKNAHAPFFEAIKVERNVMFIILTLIIVIAAFNIISGLVMLVKDKTADIAILRTMGATRGSIMAIFFMAGSLIGFIGTFLGIILGLTFCAHIEKIRLFLQQVTGQALFNPEIYFLSKLPVQVDVSEVLTVVGMSLGIAFLATLYPAWRAAKLNPAEALRHE